MHEGHSFSWELYSASSFQSLQFWGAAGGSDRLNTSSPFNIKVRSLTLRNFNAEEVAELYAQHTEDTGQVFTPEATALAF